LSRILILDIETKPIAAYVWRLWDQNVGINQIIDNGGILCVGMKWLGEKEDFLFSEWEHGKTEMLAATYNMISEADAVLTYNGDSFDLPRLMGEFLLAGWKAPPPVTSIDVYKTAKKLGFISKKLGFLGPLLGVGKKLPHQGFQLWVDVMAGDAKAQNKMGKYCVQDVKLLERVYHKLRPFMKNHPHLGQDRHECGACNSNNTQRRGYRRTKYFRIERIACNNCGSWSDGKREKI
jgi:hypothetical protein